MRYAAWESRLSKRDDNGTPTRAHLRTAAKRGSAVAIAELEGPRFPEELSYLWTWFVELRRGVDVAAEAHGAIKGGLGGGVLTLFFHGAALTWLVLDAWARRTKRDPELHEINALFALDNVWRYPETLEAA